MNTLGVSGSTIMTNAKQFDQLFKYKLPHIEIGEFKNRIEFRKFLKLIKNSPLTFGIHAPILRKHSKYDLIEHINYTPQSAIKQLDKQAKLAKRLGAKYVLVHFPFFLCKSNQDTNRLIEQGLKKLSEIQTKHGIQIVAEPKLGQNCSSCGIEYLHNFPVETWRKYGIKVCIDLGDYVMAVGEKNLLEYVDRFSEFIKVVHLHNVDYANDTYFWKPMHPADENDGHHKLEYVVKHLAKLDNLYFILEHTPHMGYSFDYVLEGKDYVQGLIGYR